MISRIFLILIISLPTFAINKDFKPIDERTPLEFNFLFDSLRDSLQGAKERQQLIEICEKIDENANGLTKENLFFLMKSEVIKSILENRFTQITKIEVNKSMIEYLEKKFSQKEGMLTPFSRYIGNSIIAELKFRESLGLITDKKFNTNDYSNNLKNEASKFDRYLRYLLPWVDKLINLPPEEINNLTIKISWMVLERINERALIFKKLSPSTAPTKANEKIFNIPATLKNEIELNKTPQKEELPSDTTLKDESSREKSKANQEMEKIIPEDLSPLSDEINKELEKVSP